MNRLRTPNSALTNELFSPNIRARRSFGWARGKQEQGEGKWGGSKSVAISEYFEYDTGVLSTLELKYRQYYMPLDPRQLVAPTQRSQEHTS